MFRNFVFAALAAFALSGATTYAADHELPPEGSLPLSTLFKALENQQAGVIVRAKYEDQVWLINIVRDDAETRVAVNPKNGEEVRREQLDEIVKALPPKDQMPLSKIVKKIEDKREGQIVGLDFEDGKWEAKLVKDGAEAKVNIDSKGETLVE